MSLSPTDQVAYASYITSDGRGGHLHPLLGSRAEATTLTVRACCHSSWARHGCYRPASSGDAELPDGSRSVGSTARHETCPGVDVEGPT